MKIGILVVLLAAGWGAWFAEQLVLAMLLWAAALISAILFTVVGKN